MIQGKVGELKENEPTVQQITLYMHLKADTHEQCNITQGLQFLSREHERLSDV